MKDLYQKLDKMSEQISKLRESAARTETQLESLLHVQSQLDALTSRQNQWKGAMVVISAIVSIVATLVSRMFK